MAACQVNLRVYVIPDVDVSFGLTLNTECVQKARSS